MESPALHPSLPGGYAGFIADFKTCATHKPRPPKSPKSTRAHERLISGIDTGHKGLMPGVRGNDRNPRSRAPTSHRLSFKTDCTSRWRFLQRLLVQRAPRNQRRSRKDPFHRSYVHHHEVRQRSASTPPVAPMIHHFRTRIQDGKFELIRCFAF